MWWVLAHALTVCRVQLLIGCVATDGATHARAHVLNVHLSCTVTITGLYYAVGLTLGVVQHLDVFGQTRLDIKDFDRDHFCRFDCTPVHLLEGEAHTPHAAVKLQEDDWVVRHICRVYVPSNIHCCQPRLAWSIHRRHGFVIWRCQAIKQSFSLFQYNRIFPPISCSSLRVKQLILI